MPYERLTDFIEELERDGELVRIETEVDPVLEITEITDRISKIEGPALFFPRVKGHDIPVAINLLGSTRRMCRALGVASFDEMADRIAALVKPQVPEGWLGKLKLAPQLAKLANIPPKIVKTGMCQSARAAAARRSDELERERRRPR